MKILGLLILSSIFLQQATAQIPTTQDCLGAIPLCSAIHSVSAIPIGSGAYPDEVNIQSSCLIDERNSIWFRFTVNASGNFGFILTPNTLTEDYDWALWDVTRSSCEDITSNNSLLVSCNAAGGTGCRGSTGATGLSIYDVQGFNCGNLPPTKFNGYSPHNALIPVTKGNNYVLVISNFSNTGNGFEIDFGLSDDIGIFDQVKPEILEWSTNTVAGCISNHISIEFSEPIQCATISAENFQITDDRGKIYAVELSSSNCDIGAPYTKFIQLDLLDPIEDNGTYILEMQQTPEYRILDLCYNTAHPLIDTFEVSENALQEINWPVDTFLCDQTILVIDVTDIHAYSYSWNDGSSDAIKEIYQAGEYSVTVSNNCDLKMANVVVVETNCDECSVYVPNVFSPFAHNPTNANFNLSSNCLLYDFKLLIYDRWGNLQFQSDDVQNSWDGQGINGNRASQGVYVYLLSYTYTHFGKTITKQVTGDVLLLD